MGETGGNDPEKNMFIAIYVRVKLIMLLPETMTGEFEMNRH